MEADKHIVISLGGSLIVPDQIDVEFLKIFTNTIKEYVAQGMRFVISPGGGKTARKYQNIAKEISKPSNDNLDWIGITSCRLNSELLRALFGDLTDDSIIMDPHNISNTNKPVLIGGSWKPGNSSDLAAVICAQTVGAKKVINLSNIDYAYNKDPKKFPDANIIKESSWPDFRAILPKEWDPGLNAPFDPIAAKKAEELGLEVVIMNGKNIENLKKYLNGEEFVGSVIH